MTLRIVPVSLAEANAFVARIHRHHGPVAGHKFSVGTAIERERERERARERARRSRDRGAPGRAGPRRRLEVLRLATDGTRNACSFLYGACARAALELGMSRIVTYTLAEESGASLRASGWTRDCEVPGRAWSRPSRPRPRQLALVEGVVHATEQDKIRWVRRLR